MLKDKVNLSVITVHRGSLIDLKRTLESIDRQVIQPKINVVIVRNVERYQISTYQKKERIFIFNKDSSIYNAMNIGIGMSEIKNTHLVFLNSGDVFLNKLTLSNLSKHLYFHKLIQGCVRLAWKDTHLNIKKTHFKNKHYSPHGAFICPPRIVNKLFNKRNKFNESHKIDADGIWMNNIRKECNSNILKIFMNISIHQLGGVSTDPTIKSVLMYFNIGLIKGIKELVKLAIQKLSITRIWYYKILYFYKYIEINKDYKD